ncbi:hypothetical protein BACT_0774 [Bifidobacterium actinocoloniiforme DSM 22766]|uniref:Uncharacterized protein n=1 Tax=Bifidobacterium actinocoloniiforme DSM 22766 TaxID=1437605 RepID=A0A086Z0M2_9BIFI|nr:hypothetical protein [Bifidobacterium actinocoloniiforme]KFI40072.1 hypothetical protein BACT_0774 [Bifidobacterium actinocoloniiforme DSM 22766]
MKRFFHDLSWAQVFAGALAAVTSFFLSAKIGIAGSAIGVAVGSVVSAVASQIYKNVLDASTHKLQTTVIGADGEEDAGSDAVDAGKDGAHDDASATTVLPPARGRAGTLGDARAATGKTGADTGASGETTVLPVIDGSDKTTVMPAVGAGRTASSAKTGGARTARSAQSGPAGLAGSGGAARNRPASHLLQNSQVQRKKRMVIIVSVVSALIAVLISALIINALTKGEGTDHVVRDIVRPNQTVQTPAPSSTAPDQYGNGSSPSTETTQPQETPSGAPSPSSSPTMGGEGNGNGASPRPSQTAQPSQQPSQTPSPSDKPSSTPQVTPTPSQSGNAAKVTSDEK